MEQPILQVEALHYTYEDGTHALRGVDLAIGKGERLVIMGSNGSGKSTLFLTLNGVLRPTQGAVLLDGKPVDYSRKGLLELRRRVGIVFQDPDNQLFCANVAGEISFGPLNLGLSEVETHQRVDRVMEELNISAFRDKPTQFLSGGQKKMVTIADILVMEPDIIIFDEPTSALDPKHSQIIDGIIHQLSERGITVVISTHDVNRALYWADRVLLMRDGAVLAQGDPGTVFSDLETLELAHLEQPAVIAIYHTLCRKGLLPEGLPLPHTAAQLNQYISAI